MHDTLILDSVSLDLSPHTFDMLESIYVKKITTHLEIVNVLQLTGLSSSCHHAAESKAGSVMFRSCVHLPSFR